MKASEAGLNRAERRAAGIARRRAGGGVLLEPAGLTGPRPEGPARLFSTDPDRNHWDQPAIPREVPAAPDDLLISVLMQLGCPRWAAEQTRTHPGMRFAAMTVYMLWLDAQEGRMVQNARTGEMTSARDLIDGIREQYAQARRDEAISDRPDHTVGLYER